MQPKKGPKAGPMAKEAKTIALQQEQLDMEAKLMELKQAMERERAKREAIIAGAVNGTLWKNGGSGLLRSNFRAKQASAGKVGPDGTPDSSSPGKAGSRSAPTSRPIIQPPQQQGEQRSMQDTSILGARVAAPSHAAPTPPRAPVTRIGRQAEVLSIRHDDEDDDDGGVGGMGCGTEANDDLADGAFSEADSHRSFLEALNEWRNASKAGEGGEAAGGASTSTGGAARVRASSANASASSASCAPMEVQTEVRPRPQRPMSAASKMSYFNKLILNNQARQAGQAAGGPAPSDMLRPASAGGRLGMGSREGAPPLPLNPNLRASLSATASSSGAHLGGAGPYGHGGAGDDEDGQAQALDPAARAMALLSRLEELEAKSQAAAKAEEDAFGEDDPGAVQVSNATGVMLTKGVRLPDAILLPRAQGEEDEDD